MKLRMCKCGAEADVVCYGNGTTKDTRAHAECPQCGRRTRQFHEPGAVVQATAAWNADDLRTEAEARRW